MSNEEENACCRVCHGESEDTNPLFHPCKCSGSIKYVHQDCLMEWLKVSNKSDEPKCELCGTIFHFSKKYCEDTPERLSVFEFVSGVLPRVASLISTVYRSIFVLLCWIILLPLWTSWTLENTTEYLLGGDIQFYLFGKEVTSILEPLAYWWNGVIACAFIVMCALAAVQSVQFILVEINRSMTEEVEEEAEEEREEEEEGGALHFPPVPVLPTLDLDDDDDEDDDDDDDDDEAGHDHDGHGDEDGENNNINRLIPESGGEESIPEDQNNTSTDDDVEDDVEDGSDDRASICTSSSDSTELSTEVELALESNEEDLLEDQVADIAHDQQQENAHEDGQVEQQNEQEQEQEQELENDDPPHVQAHAEQARAGAGAGVQMAAEDPDVIVIELGAVLTDSIWKTASRSLCFALFNFFAIQSALLLPTLLGRIAIHLVGMHASLRREGVKLMEFLESEEGGAIMTPPRPLNNNMSEEEPHQPFNKDVYVTRFVVFVEFLLGWSFLIELFIGALVILLIFKFNKAQGDNNRGRFSNTNFGEIRAKLSFFFKEVQKWAKAAVFVGLELTIIPQAIGWLIDIITMKAFNTTAAERITFFQEKPLIGGIIHFMVGFFFINHVGVFTSELRRVLREDVLVTLLPEQFIGDEYAFEVMGDQPVMKLVQRVLLTMFYCVPAILVMIMLPVNFGHHFCPYAEPFQLYFNELYYDIQLPLELLVFQFLLPFLAQKISHRQTIRYFVSRYVVHACHVLGCEELLDREVAGGVLRAGEGWGRAGAGAEADDARVRVIDVREEEEGEQNEEVGGGQQEEEHQYAPLNAVDDAGGDTDTRAEQHHHHHHHHHHGGGQGRGRGQGRGLAKTLRGLVLIAGGLFCLFLCSSWLIHVPVILGRCILKYFGVSIENDLYCICVGFSVILATGLSVHFMVKEVSRSAAALLSLCANWVGIFCQSLLVAVLWFGAAPLLLGLLFEVVLVIPIRTPLNESPAYPLLQCWAIGLLFLNFWLRSLMVGVFGENYIWRVRFDRCVRAGFVGVDLPYILRNIMAPIFLYILDRLVIPFFLARTAGLCFTQSYFTRTVIMRFSFLLYFTARLLVVAAGYLRVYIAKTHTEILDSRYLVGTELNNR